MKPIETVEIKIEGWLDEKWVERLNGFKVTHTLRNEAILAGKVKDRVAVYSPIAKLRDLGLKLISVNSSKPGIKPHHK